MNIATYNLRFGGNRHNRSHWQEIFAEVDPDLFLVQETCDPKIYLTEEFYAAHRSNIVWQTVEGRAWGSAIYVSRGEVKSIAIDDFAGWVAGAEISGLISDRLLRVFSIHAPPPYSRKVNQILDFIANRFQDDYDLVIGGDFNLCVSVREAEQPIDWSDMGVLGRIKREFGLINCWQAANPNCELAQTLRWSREPTYPYHCDGIFAPAVWYRDLESSEVLIDGWETMSDHNPVVACFEFASAATPSSAT
ncbi:hypothetical protein H6F67_20640 [Microcoleus sp. FACHB-1515]|uniref:endonuclease/exonuclease/phosphatase family protein n=1 Tax=Cyanophyceae TaxID=3028117 RepID=UPI0016882125|nr:endonuclease/exonuclease/phosphatase family protein [Microcoleus sp. FACHB-1515]MBD2092260.1 hypothetical protein [Microcoleus sp. FACHB-1515]